MNQTPNVKPIRTKEYDVPKSKYSVVGSLPTRSIILGPSGSGKSILLQNMILDIYKGLFQRIYIFSPSIDVDLGTSYAFVLIGLTLGVWFIVYYIYIIKKCLITFSNIVFILNIRTISYIYLYNGPN